MSDAPPLMFWWDGEAMRPLRQRLADKHFTVGERYTLVEQHERSAASHAHFFALIAEAHANLPEDQAERFQTSEHLRKYALIKAGFRDERSIACSSKAEAQRVAAFVTPMDGYALVAVKDAVVVVYTAKSQSYRAMGKDDFQRSKEAVLEIVSAMIGVTPKQLESAR